MTKARRWVPWTDGAGGAGSIPPEEQGLAAFADDMERVLLHMGRTVLADARAVLRTESAGLSSAQAHVLLVQLAAALEDALNVADARGARLGEDGARRGRDR